MKKKILIIKLAAIGDVLRTTPILYALKRKYPESYITWLVEKEAADLLRGNPFIDKLLIFNSESRQRLQTERLDLLLSLDKEEKALALAMQVPAQEKLGFGLNPQGDISPLNKESEYAVELGLSDELKFKKNTLTYQEQIYQIAKLDYQKDEYILKLSGQDLVRARDLFNKLGLSKENYIIGLNTGAGRRFVHKAWTIPGYVDLIKKIKNEITADILLLGGPEEIERNREIMDSVKGLAFDAGCNHSITQFARIIDFCNLIVSADTTALHIAIALKKRIVTIIGPTCSQEIDLYDRGEKIVAPLDCAPCYKNSCDKEPNCMQSISVDEVFASVKRQINPFDTPPG